MSVWVWVGIGAGGLLLISLFVGLAVAAILGRISCEISDFLESEPWTSAPLTRAKDSSPEALTGPIGIAPTRRE